MATPTTLMTVEAYRRVPDPQDGSYHELRHGELVKATRPKLKHLVFNGSCTNYFVRL